MTATRPHRGSPAALGATIAAIIALGLAGCATVTERGGQALVPSQFRAEVGPFVVFTATPLAADDGVIAQLASLRKDVEETLHLGAEAGERPIEIYILNDRKAFEHFLTFYYPELPQRRAFFIAQGDRRVVYTFKGDRLDEDLRHESTHALLSLAAGDIPLWLDEGLAEYFEAPGTKGLNREHLARLPRDVADGWLPDLPRLEGLTKVRDLTPRDYRESWAWVHYLLDDSPPGKAALLAYLAEQRTRDRAEAPRPISARLDLSPPDSARGLLVHVDTLGRSGVPRDGEASRTRLQDAPVAAEPPEMTPAPPKKRGFFARLFGRGDS